MEKSLLLQAVKRNALYWGRLSEQMILLLIGISAFYVIIFGMDADSVEEIFINASGYIGLVGLMFAWISQISYVASYMPLAISFGAKRMETVWGIQYLNFLLAVQIILLFGIVSVPAGIFSVIGWVGIGFFALAAVFCAAVGQFCSAAYIRFGVKGTVVYSIVVVGSILVALFTGMSGSINGIIERIPEMLMGDRNTLLTAAAAGVFLIYAASYLVFRRIIKNYEVRR